MANRVGHWAPARWTQPASPSAASRADLVFALVGELADLDAAVEGRSAQPVPRLDNDLALVDQVRVMVRDLLEAPAPDDVLLAAGTLIDETTRSL